MQERKIPVPHRARAVSARRPSFGKAGEYSYWEARVTVGVDPGTGKQIRRSFSGKTQKEVREKMQAAAVAVNDGDYFEPSKMTVGQWLDTMGGGVSEQRKAAHSRKLQSQH